MLDDTPPRLPASFAIHSCRFRISADQRKSHYGEETCVSQKLT